ncbi:MAG TPA: hypothetical protein VGS78_06000 [Candidatus Sulfotelmatobacter sp.]|nr:hypothetical protein [Candidatus Sulfotelmatobacter sp.]
MTASASARLEIRAHQQRDRLHRTALELIEKVDEVKQELTLPHIVRKHFVPASLTASFIAFLFGFGITSVFTREP